MSQAILALEDGFVLRGRSFGAAGQALGEVCFNTSMTGYQEILTDPSYRGQIVVLTYPQIGNYGVNLDDVESDRPHVSALVIRELSPLASNWRSTASLEDYLAQHNIPGIEGVDTRALTKHLRVAGALRGVVTTEPLSDSAACDLAKTFDYTGTNFVQQVTTPAPYIWDEDDSKSVPWHPGPTGAEGEAPPPVLPPVRHSIVAIDYGIKHNILRRLRQTGFRVKVVPATTSVDDILRDKPDGVFLSNGPGDPALLDYAHATARNLVGKTPVFGICLGHQILAHALGAKTFKLKFGHRGANQPVKDLASGKVAITSQNHGFAVTVGPESENIIEVTHVNLNDGTCAGLRHRKENVFAVQYHPEAAPGPHDAAYFFEEFSKRVESSKCSQ